MKDKLKSLAPNAYKFTQLLTPRDLSKLTVGQCKYVLITNNDSVVGKISFAVYSPRLRKNIALAMINIDYSDIGNDLKVNTNDGIFDCKIVEKPLYDPKKKIVST